MFNKDEIKQLDQRRTQTFGQIIRLTTANPLPVRRLFQVKVCIQCGARVFTDVHGTPFEPMACGH